MNEKSLYNIGATSEEEAFAGYVSERYAQVSRSGKVYEINRVFRDYNGTLFYDLKDGSNDPTPWHEDNISCFFDDVISAIRVVKDDSDNLSSLMDCYVVVFRDNLGYKVFEQKKNALAFAQANLFKVFRSFGAVWMQHLDDSNDPMPTLQCVCRMDMTGRLTFLDDKLPSFYDNVDD